jgi:hypothetical protein
VDGRLRRYYQLSPADADLLAAETARLSANSRISARRLHTLRKARRCGWRDGAGRGCGVTGRWTGTPGSGLRDRLRNTMRNTWMTSVDVRRIGSA